jgi:SAM-dependent methyltransferase
MLTKFQWFLLITILLLGINYLSIIIYDRFWRCPLRSVEGFTGTGDTGDWLSGDAIYDSFYVGIYDKITQGADRIQAEAALIIKEWENNSADKRQEWTVLDIGAGTGIAAAAMAKLGVPRIICLDKSDAMLEYIRTNTVPSTTLTDEQKKGIVTLKGDFYDSNILTTQCSHAFMTYFTVYYARDMEGLFRNIHTWVRPGGNLTVEVVNKYKFDPILDSASPFLFSTQKYSEKRRIASHVTFDQFEYEAEFDMDADPTIEFRETFRFKDGKIRRQKHELYMPAINDIVKTATYAGWTYKGYTDLLGIGFEYAYLLHFTN